MTKKELKKANSHEALRIWRFILAVLDDGIVQERTTTRLLHSNASVTTYVFDDIPVIYVLKSYDIPVAAVLLNAGAGYGIDVLRYTYGYTSTRSKHIGKFFNHYLDYKCRSSGKDSFRFRYYP